MLQCFKVCCNMLQCGAICCNVLQCVQVCCRVLQSVAVECRWRVKKAFCSYTHTVWRVAECCREMQMACQEGLLHIHAYCMACCRVLQCVCSALQCVAVRCSLLSDNDNVECDPRHCLQCVLQCVAVCCSVLQCVAVRCNALQCV